MIERAETDAVPIVELAQFVHVAAATPPAAKAPSSTQAPRGFQVLQAPAEIPSSISLADLKEPATIPEDFSGRGVEGGLASGLGLSVVPVTTTASADPIDGDLADQPPYMLPGQMGPAYPETLRKEAPDGLVVVRFVIDTLGHVERPSLAIVESTHPLFVASVRSALDRLRFLPARFSGRLVRVRMEQRFEFHLAAR